MKKLLAVLAAALLFWGTCLNSGYHAPARAEAAVPESVAAALLTDAATGKTVYEKNADAQTEFAGLVRLPALLVVCRAFDSEEIYENSVVTVTEEAARIRGATAFIAPNERIDAGLLLKAAVMLNAGDAVCALLRSIYPSEAAALEAVNSALAKIGLEKTLEFSLGAGAKFSAREIVRISAELLKSPSFLKYSSVYTDTLPHKNAAATELVNPNRLVRHYSGCYGLATGSVGSSQYCGAFAARRGSTSFIAVVAGAGTSDIRFTAARELLDYGFSAFRTVDIMDEGEAVTVLPVRGGILPNVSIITGARASALMPVNDAKVTSELLLPESVDAPVCEGDITGSLVVKNSAGETVYEIPLAAAHSVARARFADYFEMLSLGFLGLSG